MKEYFWFFISNILIDNLILSKFLGMCPFMGISQKMKNSIGIGYATIFVITLTSILSWLINFFVLKPFDLMYLNTIFYILLIAVSVQLLEIIIRSLSFKMYNSLGIFLPLITTNCAVLAIPLVNLRLNSSFLESFLRGLSSSIGFFIVITIFSSLRNSISKKNISYFFKGAPVSLITAAIVSVAFMGFNGLVKF
ncbi:RnfABCDGE type electron transport complex subunit A [Buchnera aphidicola (Mindarus keteleerifoliae)]|uniref:electron transport complex protein RnfA n=1 Tax=Buchnera aphidicola TaxID=9 RepID=UPI0031B72A31